MTDFKFDFATSHDNSDDRADTDNGCDPVDGDPKAFKVDWASADKLKTLQTLAKVEYKFGTYLLVTLSASALEDYLIEGQNRGEETSGMVVKAISGHSDLEAGQYEGGLKVWECSLDLCSYLLEFDMPVKGCGVLELGCGAGLPAILAAKMGATYVHFQDFNTEVIENYTMSNVTLNSIDESACSFFAGDWDSFAALAENSEYKYDLILTSETIYNRKSYRKLLNVFRKLLSKTGAILVAAKSEYFGVGGSVPSFTEFIKSRKQFEVEVVKHVEAGVLRKILKLTRSK